MLKTSVSLLLLALIIGSGIVSAGEINWGSSLDEGLKSAKENNKPVMVDFYTDWCGWCKKLDQDTYSSTKIQSLADKFVCVKVDGDKDRANTSKYGIDGYPTIVFMDSSGKEIDRNVGYAGPEELADMMDGILKK